MRAMDSELSRLFSTYRLSMQERMQLACMEEDLTLWGMGPVTRYIDEEKIGKMSSGQQGKAILAAAKAAVDREREKPTDYRGWTPPPRAAVAPRSEFISPETFMGRCPCPADGEQTRCCNLKTMDVVERCPFGCSYCAVQTFYGDNTVKVVDDLSSRLSSLVLDPSVWHIGTGQSSDSLVWGDDWGTLTSLADFARTHKDIIIELKTKAGRTDWIRQPWPGNVVASWSVNAETITEKEELLTASQEGRLRAARRAADCHIPVGFHIHPMVWFEGWEEEYAALIGRIASLFSPEEVMMVSFGTLTFTKSVLREIRERGERTRITDMPLIPFAGKFSYPREIKEKMFRTAYEAFPRAWKTDPDGPFFYLCFEDPSLWQPCLGRSYPSNAAFEADMREHYLRTAERFRNRGRGD